jgi:hypothetical protein
MKSRLKLREELIIGFIQTAVYESVAWPLNPNGEFSKNMSAISEAQVIQEIEKGFNDIQNTDERPHIIILPELSIPLGYRNTIKKLSAATGAVVIGGLDFVWSRNRMFNKAIVCVPSRWPSTSRSNGASHFYFGKTFYSHYEENMFPGKSTPETSMFILDAHYFGKIGVAICSDFFDLERFTIYQGRIHHLFIIAHNQDTESYYFLAEAISRLVYCNVVICNTGEFGDSLAFSPFKESYNRTIYRHKGKGLFTTQVIKLPVKDLDDAQGPSPRTKRFKTRPPGYYKHS